MKCQKILRRFSQRLSTANNIADYSEDIVAATAVAVAAGIAEDFAVEGIEDNLDTADSAEAVVDSVAADNSNAIAECNNHNSMDICTAGIAFFAAVWVLL